MKKLSPIVIVFLLLQSISLNSYGWGFFCHRLINKHAVFILPPEMLGFYKKHIDYISQHAIDPDKRSHSDPDEAVRHYIDIDYYGDQPFEVMPRKWKDAVTKYTEDTLKTYGILPWHIEVMMYRLTDAFKEGDVDRILYLSANIGHYIGDAHVPLHTSQFYDGRELYQKGVHALWETRIPELFAENYDFFVGRAQYIDKPLDNVWKWVELSNAEADSVLDIYDSLLKEFPSDMIYAFEERANVLKKQYSREFCLAMVTAMNNMVERRLQESVYHVACLWYTAWINAGQPDLKALEDKAISREHQQELDDLDYLWKNGKPKGRPNPEDEE